MNCFLDIPTQPSAIWREDLNGNKVFMWVDDHKETFWARAFRLALQRLESNPFCWTAVHQVKFSWKMFPLWNSVVSTYILQQCMTECNWEWQSTALPKRVQTQSSWLNWDAPIGNAPQAFSSGKRLCLYHSCSHMWEHLKLNNLESPVIYAWIHFFQKIETDVTIPSCYQLSVDFLLKIVL